MRSSISVLLAIVATLGLFVFVGCGSENDEGIKPVAIKGVLGGSFVQDGTQDLRVGVMASTEGGELLELASYGMHRGETTWKMILIDSPPAEAKWTSEGSVSRVTLQVFSYIDVDGTETYTDDDGTPKGVSSTKIFFFDSDYEAQGAQMGFNLQGEGGYSQDFVGTQFDLFADDQN